MKVLCNFFRRAALPACALLIGAAAMEGCASTAPRFRTGGPGRPAGTAPGAIRPGEISPPHAVMDRPWEDEPLPPALNRDHVLLEIVSLLGVPYEYGGSDAQGMDCSAFTSAVYRAALHIPLLRSTVDQYKEGTDVPRDRLRFGDLVFFNTTGESPSHVGIYIEDDLFAHASVSYGVTISSMESAYYADRFVGARRILR
jgi:cell wall-associated NlpC family hydrolase